MQDSKMNAYTKWLTLRELGGDGVINSYTLVSPDDVCLTLANTDL